MFCSVNGVAREVTGGFCSVNGKAREIVGVIMSVNGKAKRSDFNNIQSGSQTFTSNATWVAPFTGYIDIFLVNGGNGGGEGGFADAYNGFYPSATAHGGNGGAGGVCKLIFNVKVQKGTSYNVVVGAGGTGTPSASGRSARASYTSAIFGKTSSFGEYVNDPNPTASPSEGTASGGSGGYGKVSSPRGYGYWANNASSGQMGYGHLGTVYGSGGGGGGAEGWIDRSAMSYDYAQCSNASGGTNAPSGAQSLYASADASPNTGAGGGGSFARGHIWVESDDPSGALSRGGNGGSGVVIISWNDKGKMTELIEEGEVIEELIEENIGDPGEEVYLEVFSGAYFDIMHAIQSGDYTKEELLQMVEDSDDLTDEQAEFLTARIDALPR